jgi:cytosine/adenosine deaminase-related metal-dependent hydrolase
VGNAAVIPGLVNAHTHLDLSGLRGRCHPGPDFTDWLRGVIAHRRARTPAQVHADICAGLAEAIASGTTLLADISAGGQSWDILAEAPIRAVVFYEMLGLTEARAAQSLAEARAWLESHPATPTCRPGLSPHAPYSVRASLFHAVAKMDPAPPIAVHAYETRAELELLRTHTGPFVRFLSDLGAWDPAGLLPDEEDVVRVFTGPGPKLFVHGNYFGPRPSLPRGASVVYCPRTHAAFRHQRHLFSEQLQAGVRVALGTDSLASNPDLDVLAEARFIREHNSPEVIADDTLLALATLDGARALGWGHETGSLTPGKSADLVVLSLPPDDSENPHDLVLRTAAPVRGVLCRGRWLLAPPS